MKKLFLVPALAIALMISVSTVGQISGNHVYNNGSDRNYTRREGPNVVIFKDSIMLVSADILLNAQADSFVITLGLNEEAPTVKECNAGINRRIRAFILSLKESGITGKDIYVDFITQTKIYTYSVSENVATQKLKGFEIKKNIIIKISASDAFDKVIDIASEYQIYDVVKVDYVIVNTQKIYAEMMQAAGDLVKQKKNIYLVLSPVTLGTVARITKENFYAVYPNSQYRQYQAFETSEVESTGYSSFIKKEDRKNNTFYYDKIDQSGFDLVVNNASPVVGIQYVLQVELQFDIKK